MKISYRPKNSRLSKWTMSLGKLQSIPAMAVIATLLMVIFGGIILTLFLEHNAKRNLVYGVPIKSKEIVQLPGEPAPAEPVSSLKGAKLYVNASSHAAREAKSNKKFDKLSKLPTAIWITSHDAIRVATKHLEEAAKDGSVPVIVSYNFHKRDCGGYSAGGADSGEAYRSYADELAKTIGESKAVVIVEPDAIAQASAEDYTGQPCLKGHEQDGRYQLLNHAVNRFSDLPNTFVYLDAGNSRWVTDLDDLASRLEKAGIQKADGFSLNVSNFVPTEETVGFGQRLSAKLGGKHFVVDTSRNGLGTYTNTAVPTHSWCNPPGRALGHFPTTTTGQELVDAYLYVKYPGESDGSDPDPNKCFGGPKAGDWWAEYAIGLIDRWPKSLQP